MSLSPLRASLSRLSRSNLILSRLIISTLSQPQRPLQFHTCPTAFATEVPNQPPQTKLAETRLRRFWRLVSVAKHDSTTPSCSVIHLTIDGHIISLDSKPLRTPLGNTIVLPPRLSVLAYLIGAEWNVVTTGSVRQHTLPLTSLVCRAVDQLTPDTPKEIRGAVIESLLQYLDTDAILFFAPESQAHGQLLRMQTEEWTPIIQWAEQAFQVSIHSRSGEVGIGQFAKQPFATREEFRTWMQSLDAFELSALERAVMTTKSVLLATRLVMEYTCPEKCDGRYGVDGISHLASLEVRFQTSMWGEVEDSIKPPLLRVELTGSS